MRWPDRLCLVALLLSCSPFAVWHPSQYTRMYLRKRHKWRIRRRAWSSQTHHPLWSRRWTSRSWGWCARWPWSPRSSMWPATREVMVCFWGCGNRSFQNTAVKYVKTKLSASNYDCLHDTSYLFFFQMLPSRFCGHAGPSDWNDSTLTSCAVHAILITC